VYSIFDKEYSGEVTAKVFDQNGMEYGRSIVEISAEAGDAQLCGFQICGKYEIKSKSTIRFE
jgi:hypothetical protein